MGTDLAPIDGTVAAVRENPVANVPGTMGDPPASSVTFVGADGLHVVLAHVQEVEVEVGVPLERGAEVVEDREHPRVASRQVSPPANLTTSPRPTGGTTWS